MADKFSNKNKKMIIKGSGKFMARIPRCDEIVTLGTMTNMRLDIQLDMIDIEGGDTATPIDTLLRKKVIDITAEDAKFDLNLVRLVLGSKMKEGVSGEPYQILNETVTVNDDGAGALEATISRNMDDSSGGSVEVQKTNGDFLDNADYSITSGSDTISFTSGVADGDTVTVFYPILANNVDPDGYVWELEEKHEVKDGSITLTYPIQADTEGEISVRVADENKLLKQTDSAPAKGQYTVDPTTGEITLNSALDGEIVYANYKRPEVVDVLSIGSQDYPLTVSVVHDGRFEQKDGTVQGYQTELYQCRVKSNFTLDAARQTAATHSVTLTVIDPERVDKRLGVIKRYQVSEKQLDC